MRKTYILLKDTPEYNKGAIFQEKCDSGDQDFACINTETGMKGKPENPNAYYYGRHTVMNQPEWFEEVINISTTKSAINKVKKALGNNIIIIPNN